MRGGATREAGNFVSPNASNLSMSRPDEFPTSTTFLTNLRAGGNRAFTGGTQRREAIIVAADEAGDLRLLELDHHMPRHRHDVGAAFARGRQQNDRSRFEQLIDLGKDAALSSHWPAIRGSLALYAPTQRISGSFRGIGGGAAFG